MGSPSILNHIRHIGCNSGEGSHLKGGSMLPGETLLAEAVTMCVRNGMVQPHDHVVVVQKVHDAFMIKVRPLL